MTITIHLTPEEDRLLRECAARRGCDVDSYLHGLIARGLQEPAGPLDRSEDSITRVSQEPMGLDEALAPIRHQFEEGGMTDAELDALVEDARDEVWRDKQATRASDRRS